MNWAQVQFWAKTAPTGEPGISVRDHCVNVGCVAEALLSSRPAQFTALLPKGSVTLAALHDVGKISPGFVVKCPAWVTQNHLEEEARRDHWANHEPDHARVSQWTLQKRFATSKLSPWAALVGAHHGRIKGRRLTPHQIAPTGGPEWDDARRDLVDELVTRFGALPELPLPTEAMLWFVAGLMTVADWIGSDESCFNPEGGNPDSAAQTARNAVQRIGWRPVQFRVDRAFGELFPGCGTARPLQIAAMEKARTPGLYIIEAQMGSGKTEAALAVAYRLIADGQAGGLYFALPTQVTSNRIYERVAAFLSQADAEPDARRLRLAHGTSWLCEEQEPPVLRAAVSRDADLRGDVCSGRSWFASSKRALLAPFGVGTIDQALLGIVATKHFFVRQFGLAGKVVILDEVHTYDLYTGTLLDILIKRLRELHCTVVILSATLTLERRCQLLAMAGASPSEISTAYPLMTACPENQPLEEIAFPSEPPRTVRVQTSTDDPAQVAAQVMARASAGQCVLWVRNTIREAQETFRALRSSNHQDGPPIALLHSRFPQFRREELETEWLGRLGKDGANRPPGCVLVATQVVEQSVDIDADFLVSDLAPTDMLLQRMGRLWRHERPRPPGAAAALEILLPGPLAELDVQQAEARQLKAALGPGGRVYAPYVLLRSLEVWRDRPHLVLPSEIRPVLEATYADRADEPAAWRELRQELEILKNRLRNEAGSATCVWSQPALADREEVQTRYTFQTSAQLLLVTGLVSNAKGVSRATLLNGEIHSMDDYVWNFPAAKAIHRNLVRMPRYAVAAALRARPEWLRLHVSGECALGWVREDQIFWLGSDQPSGLTYHPDEGVMIPQKFKPAVSCNLEDDYESDD